MRPVWLCPLRLRGTTAPWPLYPLSPGATVRQRRLLGRRAVAAGAADGDVNRAIEAKVAELGGHKSLYSDAYYDPDTFDRLYGGAASPRSKQRYDPTTG